MCGSRHAVLPCSAAGSASSCGGVDQDSAPEAPSMVSLAFGRVHNLCVFSPALVSKDCERTLTPARAGSRCRRPNSLHGPMTSDQERDVANEEVVDTTAHVWVWVARIFYTTDGSSKRWSLCCLAVAGCSCCF